MKSLQERLKAVLSTKEGRRLYEEWKSSLGRQPASAKVGKEMGAKP